MLFCCLWRNVETYFVTNISSSSPAIKKFRRLYQRCECHIIPRSGGTVLITRDEARYWLRIAISAYPTCINSTPPLGGGGFQSEYCHDGWYEKKQNMWNPTVKNF